MSNMKKSLFCSVKAHPVTQEQQFTNKSSKDIDISDAMAKVIGECLVTEEVDGILYIRNRSPFLCKNGESET